MHQPFSEQIRAVKEPRDTSRWAWVVRHRWFLFCVAGPTVVAAFYYGLIASDLYVSESRFVVKAPQQKQAQFSTLANLIQTTGLSGGQEQTNEVLDYIRSRNALADLERKVAVRSKYQSAEADVLSRFPFPFFKDRFESLYKYYGGMVTVRLDHETGVAVLTTKAFTPNDALAINRELLGLSEGLVNRLNIRAQANQIAEADRRLKTAEERLRSARLALANYRNSAELIDPAKQATGVLEVSNGLVAQRAALEAQLETIKRGAPRNPAIPALQRQIGALAAQIAQQNGRAVGTNSGIASKLGKYENLAIEQEFATQMLNAADTSLAQARADAQKQQFYLERVVEPAEPDLALYPARFRTVLTIAAAAACLYFIAWMLFVGILEHAPED